VKLARETGTVTSACGAVYSIFDSSGKRIEACQAKMLYEMVWDILDEGYQYSAAESQSISPSTPMMDFFRDKVASSHHDRSTKEKLLQIVQMWGAFIGTDCEKQSLKFFWLEEGIDGGELRSFIPTTAEKAHSLRR
jgi:hypothetical protein